MTKLSYTAVYSFITSPVVIRVAVIVLGAVLASLAGPAAAQACSGGGSVCGG